MRFQNLVQFSTTISLCLILIFYISACGEIEDFTGSIVTPFQLTATANVTGADGTKVDCSLDLFFDLTATEKNNEFEGVYRGVLRRAIQTTDGKGFSYTTDVNASAEAHLLRPNIGRIEVPTNGISTNSRFLKELDEFVATMNEQGFGSGTWICAPLDTEINSFKDNSLSINGQFNVQPLSGN